MSQTKPKLTIIPRKEKLEVSKEHIVDVLLRITTPELDTRRFERPPLNLCVVLDRSGSMDGRKLREAIEATKMCIDRMESRDRLGLVVFDDRVETVFPNRRVTNKALLKEQVDRIFTGGSTALHAAWIAGGLEVNKRQDPAAVNRILLITDGQANVGERSPAVLSHQARELNVRGVSTTTIGIGADFNEDLLIPMAEAGGGNAWHVETPESMSRIFDIELSGLVNQFGHTVTLGVDTIPGVEVVDVMNDFEKTSDGRFKLPNLTAANDLDVVVRLRVPASFARDSKKLAKFNITFVGQRSGIPERADANLSMSFVNAEEAAAVADNAEVETAVSLMSNARDRREVMARLDRRDFTGAEALLNALFMRVASEAERNPSSVAWNSELQRVIAERDSIRASDSAMARKQMAFSRSLRVRGKFDL